MTKVLFLIEKVGNDVFAYFPEMAHNYNGYRPDNMTCYSKIGQHSACHPDYAKECKEADTNDYLPLLQELINQGYNDLQIMNKQEIEYHRQPTAFELKQGYGATHYRSFTLAETGITKTGDLKKWFVADDGLRYYR